MIAFKLLSGALTISCLNGSNNTTSSSGNQFSGFGNECRSKPSSQN